MLKGFATGLMFLVSSGCNAGLGTATSDASTTALIALTRDTTATYSLVSWNRIVQADGTTKEEWAAEFHDGNYHRVETPRDRIIADCAAITGSYLILETGALVENAEIAKAACGINANAPIVSARIDGTRANRFGPTTHLIIHDPNYIRTYDVAANGALLAATISDLEGRPQLSSWVTSFDTKVPSGIFSRESLERSAVRDELKLPPTP